MQSCKWIVVFTEELLLDGCMLAVVLSGCQSFTNSAKYQAFSLALEDIAKCRRNVVRSFAEFVKCRGRETFTTPGTIKLCFRYGVRHK